MERVVNTPAIKGQFSSGQLLILTGVLVHRVARPLRGSVSCGSGWSVPCVSIQLTLSQLFHCYFTVPPRAHPSTGSQSGSQSGSATPGLTQVQSTRSRVLRQLQAKSFHFRKLVRLHVPYMKVNFIVASSECPIREKKRVHTSQAREHGRLSTGRACQFLR